MDKYEQRNVYIVSAAHGDVVIKVFGILKEAEKYRDKFCSPKPIIDVWPCEFVVKEG